MNTEIMPINTESLARASEIIKNGGLVAFPTETVYGLGVSAYKGEGVKKVYEVKGRPSDNPLIVHLARVEDVERVSDDVTENARKLLKAFSPGPITVVLHKRKEIADEVTAGLDTVGIRIPSHEGARQFLKACDVPVAAPSANTSQRPSPTNAKDVFADMNGKIPLILDGGSSEVGIESTVIDCRFAVPVILRAGKITSSDVKRVCGEVSFADDKSEIRSPGMKYRHYAPSCAMYARYVEMDGLEEEIGKFTAEGKRVLLLGNGKARELHNKDFVYLGETVDEYMKNYFSSLRLGEKRCDVMICYLPFSESEAEGLYNRVRKSTGGQTL